MPSSDERTYFIKEAIFLCVDTAIRCCYGGKNASLAGGRCVEVLKRPTTRRSTTVTGAHMNGTRVEGGLKRKKNRVFLNIVFLIRFRRLKSNVTASYKVVEFLDDFAFWRSFSNSLCGDSRAVCSRSETLNLGNLGMSEKRFSLNASMSEPRPLMRWSISRDRSRNRSG